MKKNMGMADRAIRILIAAAFVILYLAHVVGGIWGLVLLVVAGIFVVTSIAGVCPLYSVLGIRTCKPGNV